MTVPPVVWDGVLRRLGAELPAFSLEVWVRPLTLEFQDAGVRLCCPSAFHRERVRERFLPLITRCLESETGHPVPVTLDVGPARSAAPVPRETPPDAAERPARPKRAPRGEARSRDAAPEAPARRAEQIALPYRFDSFVVGSCNALAREASFAMARGHQRGLGLLYLVSPTGLGKTHLARAIVGEARANGCDRALYAPAEWFTNQFMASIRADRMDRFKRRFRQGCDLLVFEDVQFLRSKRATQLELFHTISHLIDAGARVVLTGEVLPRDVPGLDARLGSQMAAGLVAEIEPPDARVRREILRNLAARGGVRLPDDCLERLVDAVRGNVRDLEGVMVQLVASAALLKRAIDLELAEAALRKTDPLHGRAPRLDPDAVIGVVAAFFRCSPGALASRSRRRDVLVPRQLAMYLCRRYTSAPAASIGRAFGRSHTSVTNAERVVARQVLERAPLRYQLEALCARLEELSNSRLS